MKVKFIQLSFLLLASGALIGCMSSAKELNFEAVLTGTPEQRAAQAHDYFIAVGAESDRLLTLDEGDFQKVIGSNVYGMGVSTPGIFLIAERKAGRI